MKNIETDIRSEKKLRIAVFADLHYKKGMYIASVQDLKDILARANESGVDFIIHAGDMSNDYSRSRELTDAYLKNPYGLAVYGVYGNHELESKDNSMQVVTPLLTNREVVWGTADGRIGDGSIAYYYTDIQGFRIVGLDTNYSWNPEAEEWQHNQTRSWCEPAGNTASNSLGTVQLEWLEGVLNDAAEQGISCLLFSHRGFSGVWKSSPDTDAVQELIRHANAKRQGTVLMSISGDLHSDHQKLIEDVVHFDVNTVRNGVWRGTPLEHYDRQTYRFTAYDAEGNEIESYDRPISETSMAKHTWYFADPLSAIVDVCTNGEISIEGMESSWYEDVSPDAPWVHTGITDGHYEPFSKRSK